MMTSWYSELFIPVSIRIVYDISINCTIILTSPQSRYNVNKSSSTLTLNSKYTIDWLIVIISYSLSESFEIFIQYLIDVLPLTVCIMIFLCLSLVSGCGSDLKLEHLRPFDTPFYLAITETCEFIYYSYSFKL